MTVPLSLLKGTDKKPLIVYTLKTPDVRLLLPLARLRESMDGVFIAENSIHQIDFYLLPLEVFFVTSTLLNFFVLGRVLQLGKIQRQI